MLVFDRFKSAKDAAIFVKNVKKKIGLSVRIFESQEEFDDVFALPYSLEAPIVAVDNFNERVDTFVEGVARIYGGYLASDTKNEFEVEEEEAA